MINMIARRCQSRVGSCDLTLNLRLLGGPLTQSELAAMYGLLRTDMDSAFETQGQLEDSKEEVGAVASE